MGSRRPVFPAALPLLLTVSVLSAGSQAQERIARPAITHSLRSARQAPVRSKQPPSPVLPKPTVSSDPARPHLLRSEEFLSPAQLRSGMTGYGLTVFRGNTVEKFEATILGVVKKANNGRDLILVKLGGPALRRVSDIIAGMSGSPVYIQGRIIGAVAYGAAFTRESIGYVTPIEDMLEAWDPALPQAPDDDEPDASSAPAPLPTPITLNGTTYRAVQIARSGALPSPAGVLRLRPLGARVTVSGISAARFARVASELSDLGLDARLGGGVAAPGTLKGSPLMPGGAIAMSLATGDIDITGIGTLTYRRGNRVVAFGHPFLGIGPVQAPMYTAYIHDIEPSYNESHKVGSPVDLVGTFSQDRPYSLSGQIGPKPAMLPLTVRVQDRLQGRSRTFHADLLRHPALMPKLVQIAASTAISEVHGQPGEVTALVTTAIDTDGYGTIRRTNRVQDGMTIETAAIEDLRSGLGLLTGNAYGRVGVRSISLDVDITPGKQTATVERLFLRQSRYEPGDTVEIGVVLKPYKRPEQIRTVRLTLPNNTPAGTHMISVQGGAGASGFGGGLLSMFVNRGPDYSGTVNVGQMIRRFNERERNDMLVARLSLPTASLLVQGEKLEGLPPHIETAMRMAAARSTGARVERDEIKVTEATDWVVSGIQSLPIRVVSKGQPDSTLSVPGASSTAGTSAAGGSIPAGGSGGLTPQSTRDDDDLRAVLPDRNLLPRSAAASLPDETPMGNAAPPPDSRSSATNSASAASATSVIPVGRQPGIWRQAGITDFRSGTRDGLALTSDGTLRLGSKLARVAESSEPYFWCAVPDGAGGVFAGSGDGGKIYHITSDGKCLPFAATGELEVHALARDSDGTLYAGTSPNGRIYRVSSDGKITLFQKTDARYILALALDTKKQTLFAAAGGQKAHAFAISLSDGAVTELYHGDEGSITTLTIAPNGNLYAGTSPNGLVLRLTGPEGTPLSAEQILYDAPESAVSGLVVDKDGVVYAATAPRGALYRIAPGTAPKPLTEKPSAALLNGLVQMLDGTLYTASGASVLAVNPDSGLIRTIDAPTDIQAINLCGDANGRLWVTTGSVGSIYLLDTTGGANRQGTYLSSVFDARANAQWGTLRFQADLPPHSAIDIQTRSGNTQVPDDTWSDWSRGLNTASGAPIASPPARYLQYRVTLTGSSDAPEAPMLHSLEAFYLPPNQPPQVTLVSPHGGEYWRGSKIVRWNASDPDRDTLSYQVLLSSDGGKTWKKVEAGAADITAPSGTSSASARRGASVISAGPPPASAIEAPAASLQAELDKHPEISPEMKARLLADAPPPQRPSAPPAAKPLEAITGAGRETSLSLDTSRFPDGIYLLKVITTDRPSNPTGALTAEGLSAPFQIVNRLPTLSLLKDATHIQADKSVRIEGVALHPTIAIRAVQYRVDNNGEWQSAAATDGIFDSLVETFTVTTAPLSTGTHTVEIQAVDEAGNNNTQKVTIQAN